MERAPIIVVALALTLTVPVAHPAAAAVEDGTVEVPAAGPGTGLRYEETLTGPDGPQTSTIVATVGQADTTRDERGRSLDAVPVTVQRLVDGQRVAAEVCWAHPDADRSVRHDPLLGDPVGQLAHAWRAIGASPEGAFDPLPADWRKETPDAVFTDRTCPARGALADLTLDGEGLGLETLLPEGLPVPDEAELDGEVTRSEGVFHDREARWVNASFGLRLPGPLPATDGRLAEGPLLVHGTTATLFAEGLPGPVDRRVHLDLEAPNAIGYDDGIDWRVQLTGYEAGASADLDHDRSQPSLEPTDEVTARGPSTTGFDVDVPLERVLDGLEQTGAYYRTFRAHHPHAILDEAEYDDELPPAEVPRASASLAGHPGWTVRMSDESATYEGGGAVRDVAGSGPQGFGGNDSDSTVQTYEKAPSDPHDHDGPGTVLTGADLPDGMMDPGVVEERVERAGLPDGSLDRLAYELGVRRAGTGAVVTLELASSYGSGTSPGAYRTQAVVDGETGRLVALEGSLADGSSLALPDAVPAPTFGESAQESASGEASLPAGPAEGAGLAVGAAVLWLLLLALYPVLSPLFSRISRDEVLENSVRSDLMEKIQEDPGVCLADLIEHSGVGNGATRHHLRKLSESQLVRKIEHGGYVRYFPAGEFTELEARRRATLRSGSNREVYQLYQQDPGASIREIARRLDKSPSSVHRAVKMLREVGLMRNGSNGSGSG